MAFFLFILLLTTRPLSSAVRITQSVTTVPTATSTLSEVINRLTIQVDGTEGPLGFDNNRNFEFVVTLTNSFNQQIQYLAQVTFTDPQLVYKSVMLGWIEAEVISISTPILNKLESSVQRLVNRTDQITLFTSNDTVAENLLLEEIHPTMRRLLQESVGPMSDNPCIAAAFANQESGNLWQKLAAAYDLCTPGVIGIDLLFSAVQAVSSSTSIVDNSLSTFYAQEQSLAASLGVADHYLSVVSEVATGILVLAAQTSSTELAFNQSFDLLSRYNATLFEATKNFAPVFNNVANSLEDTQAATLQHLEDLNDYVAAGISNDVNKQQAFDQLVVIMFNQSIHFINALRWSQADVGDSFSLARVVLAKIDELRLQVQARRLRTAQMFALKELITDNLHLVPFTSQADPGIAPQGYVSENATGVTDRAEFFRMQIVYNFRIGDPSVDVDPDTGVPLDTLTGAAGATWFNLKGSDAETSYTYVSERSLSLFCNNTFLLNNRNQFFTLDDLMRLVGPPNCTVGVNCNCWVRMERTRCSSATSLPYISTEAILSLSESTGICNSYDDIPLWFGQDVSEVDNSITQKPAIDFFSTSDLLNAELRAICQIALIPGTAFYLWSTASVVSNSSLGTVYAVPSNISFCSTYFMEMTYQSSVLGSPTLPYVYYSFASIAATSLFQKVSTTFEVEAYGQEDIDTTSEDQGFWAFSSQYGLLPPDVYSLHVNTMGFTSETMIPVRAFLFNGIQQNMTLTLTQITGVPDQGASNLTQQTFNLVRYDDPLITETYPNMFIAAGYLDCIYLLCPDPRNPNANVTRDNYIYDFGADELNGKVPIELRSHDADYIMQFTATDENQFTPAPNNPFTNPRFTSDFGVDGLKRQENLTQFDPSLISDSAHYRKQYIVVNETTGDVQCNPNTTSAARMGALCRILQHWRIMGRDPLHILPEIDSHNTLILTPKISSNSYLATGVFSIPSGNFTTITGSALPPLACPNPQQINILTPSTYSSFLSIDNHHSYNITLEIATAPGNSSTLNCSTTVDRTKTVNIAPHSTYQWSLPFCDVLELRITALVNITLFAQPPITQRQLCFLQTINVTQVYAARNSIFYTPELAPNATGGAIFSSVQSNLQDITNRGLLGVSLGITVAFSSFQETLNNYLAALSQRKAVNFANGSSPLLSPISEAMRKITASLQLGLSQSQQLQTLMLFASTSMDKAFATLGLANATNDEIRLQVANKLLAAALEENAQFANFIHTHPGGFGNLSAQEQANLEKLIADSASLRTSNIQLELAASQPFPVTTNEFGQPDIIPNITYIAGCGSCIGGWDWGSGFWDGMGGFTEVFNGFVNGLVAAGTDLVDLAKKLLNCVEEAAQFKIPSCACNMIPIMCNLSDLLKKLFIIILAACGAVIIGLIIWVVVKESIKKGISKSIDESGKKKKKKIELRGQSPSRKLRKRSLAEHEKLLNK